MDLFTKQTSKNYFRYVWTWLFFIFFLHHFVTLTDCQNNVERVEYRATKSGSATLEFNNIEVEKQRYGLVYVGARNRLFQLNSDLSLVDSPIITGPVDNNLVCKCDTNNQTDNINKLLLIDNRYGRVIVCGSVEQGTCEVRQQRNLKRVLRNLDASTSDSTHHVAASKNLSTIAFLANVSNKEYLFVGSSKTSFDNPDLHEKSYTTSFTVSKRALPEDNLSGEMFSNAVAYSGLTADNGIQMKPKLAKRNFRLNFINGFATEITGYFVVTHPTAESGSNSEALDVTYISQVCLDDVGQQPLYHMPSYLELPLECNSGGITYTKAIASTTVKVGSLLLNQLGLQSSNDGNLIDVVFVSFVHSNGETASALCMYTLPEIEQRFVGLATDCMKSQRGLAPSHVSWIEQGFFECNRGTLTVQTPACSSGNKVIWDVVQFLEGTPYSKNAVYYSSNSIISAIAISQTEAKDHTVAFLGTKDGKLLKLQIDSDDAESEAVVKYEEVIVDPSAQAAATPATLQEIKTLTFSWSDNVSDKRLYVMSPAAIVGLPLFDCSQYKTCSTCLGSRDPFCGWCTFENKCSYSGYCEMSNLPNSYRFLRSEDGCPRLESRLPRVITATQSQEPINLQGFKIPYVNDQYRCSFGSIYSHKVTSIQSQEGDDGRTVLIQCVSPPKNIIPQLTSGQGSLTVPLKLLYVSHSDVMEIARTDFTFYDCSVYTSCLSCLKARFNCSWCLYDNSCTQRSSNVCPQRNVNQNGKCPQLALLPSDDKVYLPHDIAQDLSFPMHNLPDGWNTFTCELNIGEGPKWFRGTRGSGGTAVLCHNVKIALTGSSRSVQASLRILFETMNGFEIDNPSDVAVEVYSCDLGAGGSCGECLGSPTKWRCDWCSSSADDAKCVLASTCPFSRSGRFCRNPKINKFTPSSAPFGGNSTIMRLQGENFDRNGEMLVHIGTISCKIISSSCCEVECVAHAKGVLYAPVSLCISVDGFRCYQSQGYSTATNQEFSFVDPIIESFDPSRGLVGWGTLITVKGQDLDTGNTVTVAVDGQPCIMQRRTSSQLTCQLECSPFNRNKRDVAAGALRRISRSTRLLRVSFDGVERTSKSGHFSFESEVSISSIRPQSTILNGGLPLYINGVNLNLIPNPQVKVTFNRETYKSDCTIQNATTLKCPSPNMARSALKRQVSVHVQITSRGCEARTVAYQRSLTYKPNPHLDQFFGDEHAKIYREEPIYITGSNLCPEQLFCDPATVRVLLSDGSKDFECNVTRLDEDQITCVPPPAEDGSYTLQVHIGGFSQKIGVLKYSPQTEYNNGAVVGVIVAVVVILVVIIAVFLSRYRSRVEAKDMELKTVQLEKDKMEVNVAKACKEGFAELQTEMNELDNLAGGVAIPYLDYPVFLVRIIYPDQRDSERQRNMLLTPSDQTDPRAPYWSNLGNRRYKQGLEGLYRLLVGNKTFLFCLIKTFEKQSTFQPQHRILEYLLSDMIRKTMEGNAHPKLMFRGGETVVEKMLGHWLSILLHGFVADCAGEPLYALCRAIKQQVNKGPVDDITGEAKYSLSEDKLLRGSIDYELISLRVSNYLSGREQSEFTVKVLTCDAISQAKRKIVDVAFMNICQSHRPTLESVDIEWRPSTLNGLILRDEDSKSKIEGDYKQVNTLAHYQVKDNDLVYLIPKRELSVHNNSIASSISRTSGVRRNGSGNRLFQSVEHSSSSLPRYMQLSRSGTPTQPLLQEDFKLWHLVKPNRQDQAEGNNKSLVSEVYLPRLLLMKGTIQKYVNDLFETIFSVVQRGHTLPHAIKHLFDFLDEQAAYYQADPEIVHAWKSNSLPLRFWVNLIKNPEFILDIDKPPIVDRYLSVIAQAFMDSCSTADNKLDKDAPSNKLLYAKEISDYRNWVRIYYSEIKGMRPLTRRELNSFLQDESITHSYHFNTDGALILLHEFIEKYSDKIINTLEEDPEAKRQQLVSHFTNICASMDGRA